MLKCLELSLDQAGGILVPSIGPTPDPPLFLRKNKQQRDGRVNFANGLQSALVDRLTCVNAKDCLRDGDQPSHPLTATEHL